MTNERLPVLHGENRPDAASPVMARAGAVRLAARNMPRDLKRAGFQVTVFRADRETHGGDWFRYSYGKKAAA